MLTLDRIRGYCLIILSINLVMLGLTFIKTSESGLTIFGAPFGGDFAEFYSAGKIINEYGAHRLYDLNLQDTLVHEQVPISPDISIPYVYLPFLALLFAPLARLSFAWAYFAWLVISTGLYVSAVLLALRRNPALPRGLTLLVALAFPPFCMYVLGGGQVSAVGCFIFAGALYLANTGRSFLSGLVLALLLYKPSLVVLIVPALLFAGQFRALIGFAVGAIVLCLVSWWMIGSEELIHLGRLLRAFGGTIGFEGSRTAKYVDLGAFVRLLFHVNLGVLPLVLIPLCAFFFRHNPWATFPATLLLNAYAPIYDLVLVVPIIIAIERIDRSVATLFVVSLVAVPVAQVTGVQMLTPVLTYLAWRMAGHRPFTRSTIVQ
ncbi:MAG TPA: glycosyltransferase family 87 protein [Pyrinomonadaceae bacterium]|nr:glycosyltransferase family 87 protein [Pyrinomonadaceae bacterium]